MKLKISSKQLLHLTKIVLLSIVFILLIVVLSRKYFYVKQIPIITSKSPEVLDESKSAEFIQRMISLEQKKIGLPIRIEIPKININTTFEHVGLTTDGAMDIPKGPAEVGWYDLGPRPGEIGSAIVAGHFGWKNGIPAVFDHLDRLEKGDKLYVDDENGVRTTFVVRESRTYDQNADASNVFVAGDGNAHLNLITCQGVWNKNQKSYSKRLVVFTDKIIE